MNTTKKLLPPDEQSLLLVSLLFARKHLDDILSFFSESQGERMNEAKLRFLRLEQGPRVTQIILELRRLLLIKENNFRWIHPSWIEHELAKEPPYLRALIEPALGDQASMARGLESQPAISQAQVLQNFLTPFLNIPQRVALFDPVLMRLQSMHHAHQASIIAGIGHYALVALSQVLPQPRFTKFIGRHFADLQLDHAQKIADNPLNYAPLKQLLLRALLDSLQLPASKLLPQLGLWLIAVYLFGHKSSWHRMIELVLERHLGMGLRERLKALAATKLELSNKAGLARMLIDAMDQAAI